MVLYDPDPTLLFKERQSQGNVISLSSVWQIYFFHKMHLKPRIFDQLDFGNNTVCLNTSHLEASGIPT